MSQWVIIPMSGHHYHYYCRPLLVEGVVDGRSLILPILLLFGRLPVVLLLGMLLLPLPPPPMLLLTLVGVNGGRFGFRAIFRVGFWNINAVFEFFWRVDDVVVAVVVVVDDDESAAEVLLL